MSTPLRTIKCAVCGTLVDLEGERRFVPFCSQRCKTIDLGRWMTGQYALDPQTGKLDIIDPDKAEEVDLGDDGERN